MYPIKKMLPTRDRIFSSFLLKIIGNLAKGQARKLFNHPLVIQPVETCPRQRQVAGFLDR
jgi:hypothetical protein